MSLASFRYRDNEKEFVDACIKIPYAQYHSFDSEEDAAWIYSSSLGLGGGTPDAHAVSEAEGMFYYSGLPSGPRLLYRTGKKWHPPTGLEAYRHLKELREVFKHPIVDVWNHDLGWKVVGIMDAHRILFTTIDVVRFKMVSFTGTFWGEVVYPTKEDEIRKPATSPVTIWIGVFPGSTSATAAHDAAQDVLALLRDYQITNVDVDFRESFYIRSAGPQLLSPVYDIDPLYDVISPLTPALGLPISSTTSLNAQGTMALYLAEGCDSDKLLGLTCRHVLVGLKEPNVDFVRHPSGRPNDVILLGGEKAFKNLLKSIQGRIGGC